MLVLYVAVGGALGAITRYALGGWIHAWAGAAFPWGTFFINASGSLLLGFLYVFLEGQPASAQWRAFLGIGFCGGFTTFSTFSYEAVRLLQSGQTGRAGVYVLGSVVVSLVAALLGFRLATTILGRG
ncbi:MAG TPA: fluoride efflux transporter CrcB [Longimicrobiales bacterium]